MPSGDPTITTVYHYSEDGTLRRFAPHVPPSNPGHPPRVWAVDAAHSPLYWFPRRCPRASVWARDDEEQALLTKLFGTEGSRICAAEIGWLTRVRRAHLYRYSFDVAQFELWEEADGQYVTTEPVRPNDVERIDDLLAAHASAELELRFTPRLGALIDQILASGLPYGLVRIRDARR